MFPRKSRSTCDTPPFYSPSMVSPELQRTHGQESLLGRRKHQSRRKIGVTNLDSPNLDELQHGTSRISWIMHTSGLATSVKKQASSMLFQFTRRKRSQIENPVIDVTTCSSQSPESPDYRNSSTTDEVNRDNHTKFRALSVTAYDKPPVCVRPGQSYSLTNSPSVERMSPGQVSPHIIHYYQSQNERISRQCSGSTESKLRSSSETNDNDDDGDEEKDENDKNTPVARTKRFSCGHVKFSDELNTSNRLGDDARGTERPPTAIPRLSLPVSWRLYWCHVRTIQNAKESVKSTKFLDFFGVRWLLMHALLSGCWWAQSMRSWAVGHTLLLILPTALNKPVIGACHFSRIWLSPAEL